MAKKKPNPKPKLSQESRSPKKPPAKGKPARGKKPDERLSKANPRGPAKRLKEERHSQGKPQSDPMRAPAIELKATGQAVRDRKRATEGKRQAARDASARLAASLRKPSRNYEAHKERERERNADRSREGRDVQSDMPEVSDKELRAACKTSFRKFCEECFPERFPLAWSEDHLEAIRLIEQSVLQGGLFALAMPRGSGKTTLSECAAIWAALYGHREFIALIGATAAHAEELLDSIKTELETNDLLLALFPAVCHPVQRLEGIANRCKGQTYDGERTRIEWAKKQIVLPTIPGSEASGVILKVAGITGRVRGMKFQRPDGPPVRPNLVIVDDPQTDRSAHSDYQCSKRLEVLTGAILGLAGPDKKIAGIMPCTVIRPGDMADVILDRDTHPEWQGQRTKLVYEWPTNQALWDQYAEIRGQSLRNGGGGKEATDFYAENLEAMKAGSAVAWPARHRPDEIDALQHAFNLRLDNPLTFDAEYQNEPKVQEKAAGRVLTAKFVASKTNNLVRRTVPLGARWITCKIDVQHSLLYFVVAAWADDFTGHVIDYGTWPEQGRSHFSLRSVTHTLANAYPGHDRDAAIRAGAKDLTDKLAKQEWMNEAGIAMRCDRISVDSADGNVAEVLYEVCRTSDYAATLIPSHGRGIGPKQTPMSAYKAKAGEKIGSHWMQTRVGKRAIRALIEDTNFWKSYIHEHLALPIGTAGAISLFGNARTDHRMFGEHIASQDCDRLTSERDHRVVDVWSKKPNHPDDHLFDCMCGAATLACFLGAKLPGRDVSKPKRRRPGTEYWE